MDHNALDEQARAILRGNDRGGYTVPTAGLYPYQWNWDSAFAAWGFATFDIDRAWTELETLFSGQWDNGMVPHILFHRDDPGYFPGPESVGRPRTTPATSGISQPPVAATLARRIYETDPEAGRARLRALFPKLLAWHRWWQGPPLRRPAWRRSPIRGNRGATTARTGIRAMAERRRLERRRLHAARHRACRSIHAARQGGLRPLSRLVQFGRECGWDQEAIMAGTARS